MADVSEKKEVPPAPTEKRVSVVAPSNQKKGSTMEGASGEKPLETDVEKAPPPRRKSVADEIKDAKKESTGFCGFVRNALSIIMSTVAFTVILCLMLAFPVTAIVFGAVWFEDCPVEQMVPIYLVVDGSVCAAVILCTLMWRCVKTKEEREREKGVGNLLGGIINAFLFGWVIVGSVYVFGLDEWDDKSGSDKFCEPILYWFAFVYIIIKLVLLALALCLCCCGLLFMSRQDDEEEP